MKTKHAEMTAIIGLKNKPIQGGNGSSGMGKGSGSVSLFTKMMMIMMMMMLCFTPASTTTLQNSQPILWRGSKTPVTTGYERVFLRIKLMNPCELLTADILHADVTKMAQIKCEEMYKEHFLNEMTKMCPIDNGYKLVRTKRFIPIILGVMVIASVVLWVGAGTAFVIAVQNTGRVSDLESVAQQQAAQIDELEQQVNVTAYIVRKLQTDFNSLVSEFERHQTDFLQFKEKQVGTTFAISYITSRFVVAKQVIREATRQWKDRKVFPGLLDFLNLTLPCGDECPIPLATTKDCFFHSGMKDLYMRFDVPKIDTNLKLLEADPFKLMMQTENSTCIVKYTGPSNAIVSGKDGCTYAANLKMHATHDLVLAPGSLRVRNKTFWCGQMRSEERA
jgi:uncharacterized coiled-coil protein SlyX